MDLIDAFIPATNAVRSSRDGRDEGGRQMRWITGENWTILSNRMTAMSCTWDRGSYCWWMIIFSTLNKLFCSVFFSSIARPEMFEMVGVSLTGSLPTISNSPSLTSNLLGCTLTEKNFKYWTKLGISQSNYPLTQCAAVSTWRSEITAPAQYWLALERYRAKKKRDDNNSSWCLI